jgi:hypothetical protein
MVKNKVSSKVDRGVVKTKSSLERLMELEAEERFLFHGSGLDLRELEPRQAFTMRDGEYVEDEAPAVWASQFVDYAIFMALINPQNCPKSASSTCGYDGVVLTFGASQDTLDQLSEESNGYVHVFDRARFILRGGSEWMCTQRIVPVETINVKRSDFNKTIAVIEPLKE